MTRQIWSHCWLRRRRNNICCQRQHWLRRRGGGSRGDGDFDGYGRPSASPVRVVRPLPQHFSPIVCYYLEHEFQEQLWCQATPAQRNGCGSFHGCCCCWCCCCCCYRRKTFYCDGDGVVLGLETMRKRVRLLMPNKYNTP